MMSNYIQLLEQIIEEMDTAIANDRQDFTDSEYVPWITFLKTVHPQSHLFKDPKERVVREKSPTTESVLFGKDIQRYSDIRDIMILAENKHYPTWFIQPYFSEALALEYEQGVLKSIFSNRNGPVEIPEMDVGKGILKHIQEFTGVVRGTWQKGESTTFCAYDIDRDMGFLEKMKLLESMGFQTTEFVLFPTDKIQTISSSKLEAFFQNYISKANEHGVSTKGIVVISDSTLLESDTRHDRTKIAFIPT